MSQVFKLAQRSFSTSFRHGLIEGGITEVLRSRLRASPSLKLVYAVVCGEVGYYDRDKDSHPYKGADIAIVKRALIDEAVTKKRLPPALLVEVMSPFNLTKEGKAEMAEKVQNALDCEGGSLAAWVVYHANIEGSPGTGVQQFKRGDNVDLDIPLVTGSTALYDGIGMENPVRVSELFDEEESENSPAPVQTQTHVPSQTQTSAPSQTQTSAPSQTQTSAPLQTQTSAPLQTQTSAPLQTQTSAPAPGPPAPAQQSPHTRT